MSPETFLAILTRAGRLKTATRHCWTASGRQESVADHSWRMALMALLLSKEPEFRELDLDRVIRMCLIHDLGEAFTGDIPTFAKGDRDRAVEQDCWASWLATFPEENREEWQALLEELEAVISHNESDRDTWLPLEYDLQFTYPEKAVQFSPWLKELKKAVDQWTEAKIKNR